MAIEARSKQGIDRGKGTDVLGCYLVMKLGFLSLCHLLLKKWGAISFFSCLLLYLDLEKG